MAKNIMLISLRKRAGLIQSEAARQIGVCVATLSRYECCLEVPVNNAVSRFEWKEAVIKMSNYYKVLPDDIWPEFVPNNSPFDEITDFEMSILTGEYTMLAGCSPDSLYDKKEMEIVLDKVIDSLPWRNSSECVRRSFGIGDNHEETTYDKIGEIKGVTRERVRQIVLKGIRTMRYGYRSRLIKDFLCN